MSLPCIFCTHSAPLPSSGPGLQQQEKTFRFLCDLLKIYEPQFTTVPICPECNNVYEKLTSLQTQLSKINGAIKLIASHLEQKIKNSVNQAGVEIAVASITCANDASLGLSLDFLKKFRDKVVNPYYSNQRHATDTTTTVDSSSVVYLASTNLTEEGTSSQEQESSNTPEYFADVGYDNDTHHGGDDYVSPNDEEEEEETPRKRRKLAGSTAKRKNNRTSTSKKSIFSRKKSSVLKPKKPTSGLRIPKCYPTNLKFKCSLCPRTFRTPYSLRNHMLYHTGKPIFNCCNLEFKSKDSLQTHNKAVHGNAKPHACTKCERRFQTLSGLDWHFKTHAFESLTCSICNGMKFKSKTSLQRHMLSHDPSKKVFVCCICPSKLARRSDMIRHMKRRHLTATNCKCNVCYQEFPTAAALITHLWSHKIKPVKCNICSLIFTTKDELTLHYSEMHGVNYSKFPCELCDAVLLSEKLFQKHMLLHKAVEDEGKIVEAEALMKRLKCDECEETFKSNHFLKKHLKNDHPNSQFLPFFCDICPKSFKFRFHLNRHAKFHAPKPPKTKENSEKTKSSKPQPESEEWKCNICNKTCSSKYILKRHVVVVHETAGNPHKCEHPNCSYATRRKDDLLKHIRVQHDPNNPPKEKKGSDVIYECEHCGHKEKHKNKLLRHLRIHEDKEARMIRKSKNVKCDICGLELLSYGLKRHVASVHGNVRRFKCDYCKQTFKRQDDVYQHIRQKHDKKFKTKRVFVKRVKVKGKFIEGKSKLRVELTNIEKLCCEYCGRHQATLEELEDHIAEHTGIVSKNRAKAKSKSAGNLNRFKIVVNPQSKDEDVKTFGDDSDEEEDTDSSGDEDVKPVFMESDDDDDDGDCERITASPSPTKSRSGRNRRPPRRFRDEDENKDDTDENADVESSNEDVKPIVVFVESNDGEECIDNATSISASQDDTASPSKSGRNRRSPRRLCENTDDKDENTLERSTAGTSGLSMPSLSLID